MMLASCERQTAKVNDGSGFSHQIFDVLQDIDCSYSCSSMRSVPGFLVRVTDENKRSGPLLRSQLRRLALLLPTRTNPIAFICN